MFTPQRQRPRFKVDLAEPAPRRRLPFRVVVERPRKKPRFRVGPTDQPERRLLPFRIAIQRQRPRRRSSAGWAQIHTVRRWAARAIAATRAPRRRLRAWALRLVPVTLGERRWLRAWALRLALAVVLLAAALGGLSLSPLLQKPANVHSAKATSSVSDTTEKWEIEQQKARARNPTPPFPSLQAYIPAAGSKPPAVQAASAFVFDPDRGIVFFQKDADQPRPLASTTKVMTLLLASRFNLDQTVTVGPDAAALVNGDNSYMGVSAGEQLTLRDLLDGLVVASGNDAAVAIADQVGGTEARFVAMMNRQAWLLGLNQTHFVSPDGLDDGNRASARDLAVLSAVALQDPDVERITSTRHLKIPQTSTHKAYEMWNGNDLLAGGAAPYPGVIGVKTGYTTEAMYCMAFAARLQGHLIVGVVLGAPSSAARAGDAHALLDWAAQQG